MFFRKSINRLSGPTWIRLSTRWNQMETIRYNTALTIPVPQEVTPGENYSKNKVCRLFSNGVDIENFAVSKK